MLAQTLSISRCTGPLADGLIEGGMPVGRVRKLAQATAFLGPTAALAAAAVCDDGPITVGEPSTFARPPWHACQTYRHSTNRASGVLALYMSPSQDSAM